MAATRPDIPWSDELLTSSLVDRATRTVAAGVPCVHCEYNLQTLPVDGSCPECGRPVAGSLQLSGLCYARSEWLTIVRDGFAWIALGMTVFVVCVPVLLAAIRFPALGGTSLLGVVLVAGIAGLLGALFGVAHVIEPDSERGRIDEPVVARKVVQRLINVLEIAAVPFAIGFLLGWEKLQLVGCACMACVLSLLVAVFGMYIRWFGNHWRSARIRGMTIAAIVTTAVCGVAAVSALLLRLPVSASFGRKVIMAVIPRSISSPTDLVSVAAIALVGATCVLWTVLAFFYWRLFIRASAFSRDLEEAGLVKRPSWLAELQK